MNIPEWLKPGVAGAVLGAIGLAVVGFSYGGWVTSSTAATMSEEGVRLAMVPVCVELSTLDVDREAKLETIRSEPTYGRRDALIGAGWATMPGTESPDRELATACLNELDLDGS